MTDVEKLTVLTTGRFTSVQYVDIVGPGGAFHKYLFSRANEPVGFAGEFGTVHFQNGPVAESGVNGCHQEDLLAIVIHRLECFQAGTYACRENALALTKLQEALHWLNHRTAKRQERGVEGTSAL